MVSMSVKKKQPSFFKTRLLLTINPQGFNFFQHKYIKNDKQNKNLFNYSTA